MVTTDLIVDIKTQMQARFQMHDLGTVSFYLGMNIERNRNLCTIDIHQHAYIKMILEKFGMDKAKTVATPIAIKLHKRTPDEEPCDQKLYQSMIGSLMYAIAATRPDIAFAIGVLSRYSHDPSKEHMVAVKRAFRYLNGTKHWKLRIGGESNNIFCYVDSDYAGDPDDYKSTSRLVVTFGGAVDWRSQKQKSTAQSTTDAEYYAFGVGCMRLTQIIHLMEELGIDCKPKILTDSQSMLASIKGRIYRGTAVIRMATKYHLAADMVRDGEVEMEYISSDEMIADMFTKELLKPSLLKQCMSMGMIGIGSGSEV